MKAPKFEINLQELAAETILLNEIPAPTFEEGLKASYVKAEFEKMGLKNVRQDQAGNVLGELAAVRTGGEVVLAAHLDTVFPVGTDLKVRQEKNRLVGPGTGDNNVALAALLQAARFFCRAGLNLKKPIVFAATVGEEGLGDLAGVRALFQQYREDKRLPSAFIAVEGHGLGNVCHQGVGSRRMELVVRGPGGHSWDKAGQPSAIHLLADIMKKMTAVVIPESPRTSFNIGTIKGGISVNTIAPEASIVFEVRSVDAGTLDLVFGRMLEIIETSRVPATKLETRIVGDRPAGSIPKNSPLIELCSNVYRELGIEPSYYAYSTDANIGLSIGLPAVCIGITRGGNAHRQDEWIEISPAAKGVRALIQIAYELAV